MWGDHNKAVSGLRLMYIPRHAKKNLDIFLKGSKKQEKVLEQAQPELYAKFQVWSVRSEHMVVGLPSSYMFFLKCCFKPGCIHPLCQQRPQHAVNTWYPGGASLNYLPKNSMA